MAEIRHIIVGIDPGATFGIAAIGLDGRKVAMRSTMGGFGCALQSGAGFAAFWWTGRPRVLN